MAEERDNQAESDHWDNRILCSDESCIGIIGADGRCKVCGKPYAGQLAPGFLSHPADSRDTGAPQVADPVLEQPGEGLLQEDSLLEPQGDASLETEPEEADADPIDWDHRVLCSDDNCIGIIGSDGRCKTCGKPFEEKD